MIHIVLDSRNGIKQSGTSDTCNYTLRNFPPNKTLSCRLVKAIVPNLRYPVNSRNNVITYTGTIGTGTATIPAAAYSSTTFADAIQATLRTATSSATLTVTFSATTYLLTIATGDVNTISVSGISAEIMGFPDIAITAATSIVGLYPIRLDGSMYVDLVVGGVNIETYTDSSINSALRIMERIPLDQPFGNIVYFEPTNPVSFKCNSQTFLNFSLSMVGDDGLPWTLPVGVDCAFHIVCEVDGAKLDTDSKKRRLLS